MKLKIINRILCISLIFIFTFTTFYSYSKVYGKTYYVNSALFNDNLIFSASNMPDFSLYARYAALIDGDNNRLLFGKNEDTKVPMASTTKIMTCIIALENAPDNLCCTTSALASSTPEVKLFAKEGEKFKLIDMLYSLMLKSHNDTAVIIAENVAKYILTEKNIINISDYSSNDLVKYFVGLMNNKAKDFCSQLRRGATLDLMEQREERLWTISIAHDSLLHRLTLSSPPVLLPLLSPPPTHFNMLL